MTPESTIEELIEILNKGGMLRREQMETLKKEINNEKQKINHTHNSL